MIHNTPPLLLINSVAMLHETQDLKTKKAQISMIFCIMSVIIFLDKRFSSPGFSSFLTFTLNKASPVHTRPWLTESDVWFG